MKNTHRIGLTLLTLSATAASSFAAITLNIEGNRNDNFTTWTLTGSVVKFTPHDVNNTVNHFDTANNNTDIRVNSFTHADGKLVNSDFGGNGNDAFFDTGSSINNTILAPTIVSGSMNATGTGAVGPWNFEGVRIISNGIDGTNTFQWFSSGAFGDADSLNAVATTTFTDLVFTVPVSITEFGVGSNSVANGYLGTFGLESDTNTDQRPEALVVNITAVPEPSSTALLGLGGLALMFRRRRA